MFDLECDYDNVALFSELSSQRRQIWSGGCTRSKEFSLFGDVKRNVTIELVADATFSHTGFQAFYKVEETTAPELSDSQLAAVG